MAFLDELQRALLNWQAGRPAILPPLPPEPGTASGQPAPSPGGIMPVAQDGSPLLDSGIHMYQPRDIGELKWTNRYRRLIKLASGMGIQDYPGTLIAAMVLNQFNPEDFYPDELLWAAPSLSAQNAAKRSTIWWRNPSTSKVVAILDRAEVARLQTAGRIFFFLRAAVANVSFSPGVTRDLRMNLGTFSTVGVDTDNTQAAPGGTTASWTAVSGAASTPGRIDFPYILMPGFEVVVFPDIDNEGIHATFAWRERPVASLTGV